MTTPADVVARLRAACVGHPFAKIPWPHRILHDAAALITSLEARAETAERERDMAADNLRAATEQHVADMAEMDADRCAAKAEAATLRKRVEMLEEARPAKVSVKTMRKSGGEADYFVSIEVGDREVTPHVFIDRYKADYHAALYDWLLNGKPEPDLMAYRPSTALATLTSKETENV